MAEPTFLPEFATANTYPDGSPNKQRPDSSLRQYGFPAVYEPTAQEFNWELNNIYEWLAHLKDSVSVGFRFPVGYILHSSNGANPATYLGYGTWTAIAGRVLIGAGTATDANGNSVTFSAGTTGGNYKVMLLNSDIPDHTHPLKDAYMFEQGSAMGADVPADKRIAASGLNNGFGQGAINYDNDTLVFRNTTTDPSPTVQTAVDITPAHRVVYIWERTA